MPKTEIINTRVEPKIKKTATAILKSLGLTPTDAINMFLHQVIIHDGLPFEVRKPNKETLKAMRDLKAGRNMKIYSSLRELKDEFE